MSFYAIDFGTSNSLLTYVDQTGKITEVPLSGENSILRSLIFTPNSDEWFFGDEAIEKYMEHDGEGRFFRSLKKFLPEASYKGTEVHNKMHSLESLIGAFLREMRSRANKFTGKDITKVLLGRPALYSSEESADQLAEGRMIKAANLAGFDEVHFCPEPLAAGIDYQTTSKSEKIIMIADFGGGTSDFTILKTDNTEYSKENILGVSGIFKAGDAFDGEMMLKFIAKNFGASFEYKLPVGTNILKFPRSLLQKLCSPAHITHLREKDTWAFLQEIEKFSLSPSDEKQMEQLFTLVECQLGFPIFNEIEKTKIALSSNQKKIYNFIYKYPGIDIEEEITVSEYFEKMEPVMNDIICAMNDSLKQAGLNFSQIDEVCITGGTGQFSVIQEKLRELFGSEKINQHNTYGSVVAGLAHFGRQLRI